MLRRLIYLWCMALGCSLMTGCSVIDEDLTNCDQPLPPDPPTPEEPEAELNYDLRLVTNMTTELQTELTTQTDIELANALRDYLGNIFTDFAHDVDLSFYDTEGDSMLLQKDQHIMDANQASYMLNLPMREYMHLAAANVMDNELVTIGNDIRCHSSMLLQTIRDTIESHTTGLFTARQKMEVLGNVSQNFNVHLYMANCAAALVLDPRGFGSLDRVRVYSTGFASGFSICDSLFYFDQKPPVVRSETIKLDHLAERAFCSVTFPSREPSTTRTIIETTEPFIAQPGEESLWEFRVYVTVPATAEKEESITETILRIREPLRAGQLKIIKAWIGEQGEVVSDAPELTTSVTLDWKDGLHIVTTR